MPDKLKKKNEETRYNPMPRKAVLALADGRVFHGYGFGAEGEGIGEVVFNTSMTGYQEVLSDPSYRGQLVAMTYPLIGSTGVNHQDMEGRRPYLSGFVVKEYIPRPSNWRANDDLDAFLKQHQIVGIQGVDTRALTKHIRDAGAQQGMISTTDLDEARLVRKAREAPGLVGRDLVTEVCCKESYEWTEAGWRFEGNGSASELASEAGQAVKVVVFDFGVKKNILRSLVDAGCSVTVVPASTKASEVLAMEPDGVLLSNGPGDPEGVSYAVESVRSLIGRKPIFGICLGHQILALALEGSTYKLKFGHHGANQPVMDLGTRKVEITAQNHGFAVDLNSIGSEMELTHINLNDRTVEGMRHKKFPILSIQYHPEASPGPHDSAYLFHRFVEMIQNA